MPLDLTTPIDICSCKPESTASLQVIRFYVDYSALIGQVWLGREEAGSVFPIEDAAFVINNVTAEEVRVYGGKSFTIPAGNYFDDMLAAAASGTSVFDVVKNSVYSMLGTMYGLAGTVT